MTAAPIAAAVFDRPRSAKAEARDEALLAAACDMDLFTVQDLVRATGGVSWHSAAGFLLRTLVREGRMRVVSPPGAKPFVYEWAPDARPAGHGQRITVAGVRARRSQQSVGPVDELHLLVLQAIADGHPEPADLARAALGPTGGEPT